MARRRVRGCQANGCYTLEDGRRLQPLNEAGRDVLPAHTRTNDELSHPPDSSAVIVPYCSEGMANQFLGTRVLTPLLVQVADNENGIVGVRHTLLAQPLDRQLDPRTWLGEFCASGVLAPNSIVSAEEVGTAFQEGVGDFVSGMGNVSPLDGSTGDSS